MAIGRNQPCPCGSGQKYKNCCAGKSRGASKGLITLIVVIALIAAVGGAASFMSRKNSAARATATNPQAGRPQPGPAPPGKVWSAEHGHWHDAAPGAAQGGAQPGRATMPATQTAAPTAPVPQPSGTPPPGKVWSPEHGHWHDAPK